MNHAFYGRVTSIGRSDCIGSAGVQGDAKVITAMGGLASSVITSVNASDGGEGSDSIEIASNIIVRQIETVLYTVGVDCVKIGSMISSEQIDMVAYTVNRVLPMVPLLVSPALLTHNGRPRMSTRALAAFKRQLMLERAVMTLSVKEAEMLTGVQIMDEDQLQHVAIMLQTLGNRAVFVHGADFDTGYLIDILVTENGLTIYDDAPIELASLYGVRNALAAAAATCIGSGQSVEEAIRLARHYVNLGSREDSRNSAWKTLDFMAGARVDFHESA